MAAAHSTVPQQLIRALEDMASASKKTSELAAKIGGKKRPRDAAARPTPSKNTDRSTHRATLIKLAKDVESTYARTCSLSARFGPAASSLAKDGNGRAAAIPVASSHTLDYQPPRHRYPPPTGTKDDKPVKKGKFSKEELELSAKAFEDTFFEFYGYPPEVMDADRFLYPDHGKKKSETLKKDQRGFSHGFWKSVKERCDTLYMQRGLPERPKGSFQHMLVGELHKKRATPWTAEDVDDVRRLRGLGTRWHVIGELTGRSGTACSQALNDYNTNHRLGRLTREEEQHLIRLVLASVKSKKDDGSPGFREKLLRTKLPWKSMSLNFPGRSANQLRDAWLSRLCPSVLKANESTPQDDLELLRAVQESGAMDESGVVWCRVHPRMSGRAAQQRVEQLSKQLGYGAPSRLDLRVDALIKALERQAEAAGEGDVVAAACRLAAGEPEMSVADDM